MSQWVNENIGIILTVLNSLIGALVAIRGRNATDALLAKDATIELYRTKCDGLSKIASEYEDYKKQKDQQDKRNENTIDQLHKRISDLEANQVLTVDEQGFAVIKKKDG